jgi:hypothetical protein
MKQFTSEEIQSQYEKLPKDLQDAISSTEVHDSIVAIGNKYELHVDQLGEMVDLVGLIMLGLSPSKDFVNNFSREAGVKTDIASSVAQDINKEVFDRIRASMQKIEAEGGHARELQTNEINKETVEEQQTKSQQSITDLERIGGFSIEPTGQNGNGNGSAPANLPGAEEVAESKDDLVSGIENPTSIATSSLIATKPSITAPEENHTDIIVDHLLAGPVAAAEQKTVKPVEPVKSAPTEPKKPVGHDSYREPTN